MVAVNATTLLQGHLLVEQFVLHLQWLLSSSILCLLITAVNEVVVSVMSHRVLQTFSIMHIGEVKILLLNKSKKPVCVRENMYDVIGSIHQDLHHAGYKKTATLPEN